MTPILKYINRRLTQMQKDKASPLIVSDGERELLEVRRLLMEDKKRNETVPPINAG